MTCMIVDDEPLAVKLLETFVGRADDLELKGSFTDSIEALDVLAREPVDLLFLDIQMPDLNGMELAHAIDTERTRVIFTTAFKDYAFESYEINALDYLLKPIRYIKFQAAVEKARHFFAMKESANIANSSPLQTSNKEDDFIFLRADGELHQIALASILYIEGMKDYLKFYIEGKSKPLITHMTMTAAEEMLTAAGFMRINRSFIVSLSHIRRIDRNDCVYIGEQIIRVTEAYKEQFNQYITKRTSKS